MSTKVYDPERREVLRLFALAPLVACVGKSADEGLDSAADTHLEVCPQTPAETGGPFPGDGSNGPNVLDDQAAVRSDIRTSIGEYSGTAEGVLLTLTMTVVDTECAPVPNRPVYIWQADKDGEYSMYTLTTENYLRGVQVTGSDGVVTFTSVFPGCYPGRWPHIHFAVYASLAAMQAGESPVLTSQLAFAQDVCESVYAEQSYGDSDANLDALSLATDSVFRDGAELQTAAVSGDLASGLNATLQVSLATG